MYPIQTGKCGPNLDSGTVPYDLGYYQTECTPVGKEANGKENNSTLINVLIDNGYLCLEKKL